MAPISEESLMNVFTENGFNCDEDVAIRLKDLCETFRLCEDDLVEEWMAFSLNHSGCIVTFETLSQFEREVLQKKFLNKSTHARNQKSGVKNYNYAGDPSDELLGLYGGEQYNTTPEVKKARSVFSKSARSSTASPLQSPLSVKYLARTNSGETVASWPAENTSDDWKTLCHDSHAKLTIENISAVGSKENDEMKYMFQKTSSKLAALTKAQKNLGEHIVQTIKEDVADVFVANQEDVLVMGRVTTESSDKPTASDLLLENFGYRMGSVELDVGLLRQYSLFPGQTVVMKGSNRTGKKFQAAQVLDIPLSPFNEGFELLQPLNVVIASGPFSLADNTANEPLSDLLSHLQQQPADVCILLGPFVDATNAEIGLANMDKTFEEQFFDILMTIYDQLENARTRFVIVPSQRDIHHHPVYPQPAFSTARLPKKKPDIAFDESRFVFVTNPATVNIGGVVFGLTSTDILLHLSLKELSFPSGATNRLAQLSEHLLRQRSYYPLYPPSEDVNFDYTLFGNHGNLPVTPHVLVLPSHLRFFIKDVGGCLCVNPGQLTKGQTGGTFARLVVQPSTQWSVDRVRACITRV